MRISRLLTLTLALALGLSLSLGVACADTFSVSGNKILYNGLAKTWRGANTMFVFGGTAAQMSAWNLDIVRVFIGNMENTPLSGDAVYVDGAWLHPLQEIVNGNRAQGKVTILCPFGWNNSTLPFSGLNPSQQSFYNAYKTKMRAWATLFKTQPDVWLEVWNEPYRWDNGNGYSDTLWRDDMRDMIANIRSTGAANIILVPGNRQGQGEEAILNQGRAVKNGNTNLVFDLHAYERWLEGSGEPGTDLAAVESRITAVRDKNLAVIFGEIGPMNAGALMNPATFLEAARRLDVTTIGWLWKYDGNDQDALLDAMGNPNDTANNAWGTSFLHFGLGLRGVVTSHTAVGTQPGYAVDGDTATRWSTGALQKKGQSIVVSLGPGMSWNHLRLDMGNWPQEYPRGYELYVSNDGVNWTLTASGVGTAYVTDIWPGPQWSQYVKIVQTGSAPTWWSIAELEVRQD